MNKPKGKHLKQKQTIGPLTRPYIAPPSGDSDDLLLNGAER